MKVPLIYARVSTIDKQDYQRQINDLKRVTKDHGYLYEVKTNELILRECFLF